ncbi:MAG: exodeoxyribonuclease I, partial [Rhodothermales bacterium]
LMYRNLRDPYAWHWRNGNSRWDVIDLMRAAFALRPDGIEWPRRDDGAPSFRLEDIAAANGLRNDSPHEALADVRTMIDLVRLVREKKPDLFDYYLKLRDKRAVARHLKSPFVWISSLIGAERGCASLMAPVTRHPQDSNAVIAFDLYHDPTPFTKTSPEDLRAALFGRADSEGSDGEGMDRRPPLYKIKTNACPFVGSAGLLDADVRGRLGLDEAALQANYRNLTSASGFADTVYAALERDVDRADVDVDAALYTGFIPDADREMLSQMLDADLSLAGAPEVRFEDGRLADLVFRYRARNFPHTLNEEETARWRAHCRSRHLEPGEDGRSSMDAYTASIERLREEHPNDEQVAELLDDLADYGRRLRRWLG